MDILAQSGHQTKHCTMTNARDGKQIGLKITQRNLGDVERGHILTALLFVF